MGRWFGRRVQVAWSCESRLVLPESDENTASTLRGQRQEVITVAARTAHARRDIRQIHVVLNERPAYDEIDGFRQVAEDQDLEMSVDGSGTVSLRAHGAAVAPHEYGRVRRSGGKQT